jgi:alginate O-acetyltransferase complex protein AlgI
MTFVSFEFVVFFAIALLGLAVLRGRTARQAFLLVASCAFYAAGTPWHLLVLAVPAVVDYVIGIRLETETEERVRKLWLVLSVVSNVGLLAWFKYADFFAGAISSFVGAEPARLLYALPIGISFFTFKALSYTIDVYRRAIPACRSPWRFALFISFFPELVAGPIVRASVFLPQLDRSLAPSLARVSSAVPIILLGLTKKLMIANRLAGFADPVFQSPESYSAATVASAVLAYSLQIYCDFSGYSDMAIGVARIIGIDLPENFNMPYAATSITEFWRRWHITLSEWLRDYLYIPLGGNRRGVRRMYANLMITMLLGGLWHGASWNFVIWGGLHGLGLAVHKRFATRGRAPSNAARVLGWIATFAFVSLCWVFFRVETLSGAVFILRKLAGLEPGGANWMYLPLYLSLAAVVVAHLIGARSSSRDLRHAAPDDDVIPSHPEQFGWANTRLRLNFTTGFVVTVWIIALYLFSPMRTSPFIYFQF